MPLPESLNPIHLSKIRAFEPQRQNNFEVEIFGLAGGPGAARNITLAVNSWGLPNITTDPQPVSRGNSEIKYAGKATFGGADSLEVMDFIGLDVEKIINQWQKEVYDPNTGKIGWGADYKKEAMITEFAPDGTELRSWKLEGVWPSGVDYGSALSHESADFKRVTMAMSYDRAFRQ